MNFLTRKLFYALPPAWRFAVRRLRFLPLDAWESLAGKRGELTPPRGLIYTGGGDFQKAGEAAVGHFKEFCALHPRSRVLDAGSGIGRIAVPLTRLLDSARGGSYDGFDVVKTGVEWCVENISARFPNFHFRHVPLDNDLYRRGGSSAADFRFPYESGRFDLVVANSLFTHMLPEEVDNYLGEIFRVLRPGGLCYATFFLFDENTRYPWDFSFPHDFGSHRLMDAAVKSANVAYAEPFFKTALVEKNGLRLRHLFRGSWGGLPKESCKDFQDIAILEKPKAVEDLRI